MKIPHLNLRTKEPRVSSAGFTLLELLMASAAFAMIVL
ncbi:MAG: prepilin-type N-terminal cleavage/methylation domain-containing protein, partial [Limisphaerales bacterium]